MSGTRPGPYRSDMCGSLGAADAGRAVRLAGWVHRRRDMGGVVFLDLRDREGLVQVVARPDGPPVGPNPAPSPARSGARPRRGSPPAAPLADRRCAGVP